MKASLVPQLLFLLGCVCFLVGTLINIAQTVRDEDPPNINCGADRP